MTTCLSDLCLDELMAGELSRDAEPGVVRHLSDCGRCQDRHAALLADRSRFRAAIPPLGAPRVRRRGAALVGGSVLAIAASLVLVAGSPTEGTRTKGGARLGFVVVRGEVMRAGAADEQVHPGDTLSFLVTSPRPIYAAVLSRDGAGRVSVYFPAGARAERVVAGREIQLAQAVIVDDTLGREQLYGVFCDEPVAVTALRDAIDRALPAGCSVDQVAIEKLR